MAQQHTDTNPATLDVAATPPPAPDVAAVRTEAADPATRCPPLHREYEQAKQTHDNVFNQNSQETEALKEKIRLLEHGSEAQMESFRELVALHKQHNETIDTLSKIRKEKLAAYEDCIARGYLPPPPANPSWRPAGSEESASKGGGKDKFKRKTKRRRKSKQRKQSKKKKPSKRRRQSKKRRR